MDNHCDNEHEGNCSHFQETGKFDEKNHISSFYHCRLCILEVRAGGGTSAKKYARTEWGYTKWGIQVWCLRHDMNIFHMNLEGQKHPATFYGQTPEDAERDPHPSLTKDPGRTT